MLRLETFHVIQINGDRESRHMVHTSARAPYSAQLPFDDRLTLSKKICALLIKTDEAGQEHFAELAQIGPGCKVQICGPGYNERTLRVLADGQPMFVFEADLR
jgi:hypothetical protein